jgi:hypothetical protein
MSADDFSYTTVAVTQGVLKAQVAWYTSFTGKFINNFLVTIFGIMSSRNGSTLLYFLITLTALFSTVFIFFKKNKELGLGVIYSVLFSLLFLVSYYFITPDKNESWYWLAGSVEYLWPTIFVVLTFAFAFEKGPTLVGRVLSFVLAFLVGGGSEVAGTLLLGGLSLPLVYLAVSEFINKKESSLSGYLRNLFDKDKLFSRLFVVFVGASLSFLIMFLAPGNGIRIKGPGSDEMSIAGAIFYSLQKGPALTLTILKNNFLFLSSLFVTLTAFFGYFGDKLEESLAKEKALGKVFFVLIAPFFISFIYLLPGYKALGRALPSRAEIDLSFIIIVSLFYAAYYLSRINIEKRYVFDKLVFVATLVFFVSSFLGFSKTVAEDIYVAKNYSDAFGVMFSRLKIASAENKNQIVIVDALPESGLIHSEKLTSDPGHWANQPISNFFGLKGITIKVAATEPTEVKKVK